MSEKETQIIRKAVLSKLEENKITTGAFAAIMLKKHKVHRSTTHSFLVKNKSITTNTADKMLKELDLIIK